MNSAQKKQWQNKVDEYNKLAERYNATVKWHDEKLPIMEAMLDNPTDRDKMLELGEQFDRNNDKQRKIEKEMIDISREIHSLEFQFNGWTAYNMN